MPSEKQKKAFLAGDIGGTKTRLALFAPESGVRAPLSEAIFASRDYPSLEALAGEFISRLDTRIEYASFGVAGPVVNGQARITNLPWVMDEAGLADTLHLKSAHLLNDLEAIARAVPSLDAGDLVMLNRGLPAARSAIAVIAPGTGLGEAFLIWDGAGYRACPSEGGHTDFAPNTELETRMLRYLRGRLSHVSWEHVCSGSGLPNIYAFLKDSGHAEEPDWLSDQLATANDPTAVIVSMALNPDRPCRLCRSALDTFIAILGAEAGNLALKVMATGGVYLGGGIPPRIMPALRGGMFMDAFGSKGRLSRMMTQIPVYVIMNPKAALWGAACRAMELVGDAEHRGDDRILHL